MRKERLDLPLPLLRLNEGQIDWLPANPRTWTKEDLDNTRDSIREDPDFLEDRPLLVVPFGSGAFVIFAGNLRGEGARELKLGKAPCVVYHPETEEDYETILRRAMKDNGQFGRTDWNAIFSSKWGTLSLEKWGLTPHDWTHPEGGGNGPSGEGGGSPEDYGTDFKLPNGEKDPFQQMSFTLTDEQVAEVKEALREAKGSDEFKFWDFHGNENGNGNALALIIEQWRQQRK